MSNMFSCFRQQAESSGIGLPTTTVDDLVLPSPNLMKSLMDLYPFFHALEQHGPRLKISEESLVSSMEKSLEKDFLEPIPT